MHPTEIIDRDSLRDDIPEFRPGDTVKVHAADGDLVLERAATADEAQEAARSTAAAGVDP